SRVPGAGDLDPGDDGPVACRCPLPLDGDAAVSERSGSGRVRGRPERGCRPCGDRRPPGGLRALPGNGRRGRAARSDRRHGPRGARRAAVVARLAGAGRGGGRARPRAALPLECRSAHRVGPLDHLAVDRVLRRAGPAPVTALLLAALALQSPAADTLRQLALRLPAAALVAETRARPAAAREAV